MKHYHRFGDGGRGLAALGFTNNVVVNAKGSVLEERDGKWFNKETGEEAKVITLAEFLGLKEEDENE